MRKTITPLLCILIFATFSCTNLNAQCEFFSVSPSTAYFTDGCELLVKPEMVGGAGPGCGPPSIEVYDETGALVPNPVPISYVGANLRYCLSVPDYPGCSRGDLILTYNSMMACRSDVTVTQTSSTTERTLIEAAIVNPVCLDILELVIKDAEGNTVSVPVDYFYDGQVLDYTITDVITGNACFGQIVFDVEYRCIDEYVKVLAPGECYADFDALNFVLTEIPSDDYILQIYDADGEVVPIPVPPLSKYFCTPLKAVITFLDGSTCEVVLYVIDVSAPVLSGSLVVSMTFQQYLSGLAYYPTADDCVSGVTFTFEDEEIYQSCELLRFRRTYTATDLCGNSSTFVQFIDIQDFYSCRFIGPYELPIDFETWIHFGIPKFLQGYTIKWKVSGKDWKVLDQKEASLLVIPGKSNVNISVEITDLFLGKTYFYNQKFKGKKFKPGKNSAEKIEGISIYPNPTSDLVNISVDQVEDLKSVRLYDVYGKMVKVIRVDQNADGLLQVSLADLPQGVYLMDIQTSGGERIVEKVFLAK